MILIIGGAYQGKLAYAKEHLGLNEEDIYRIGTLASIEDGLKSLSYPVLYGMEHWIHAMAVDGEDGLNYIKDRQELFQDKIIICEDNSCGVVPINETERAYREMAGQILTYWSQNADCVIRVFCGIGTVLKGTGVNE